MRKVRWSALGLGVLSVGLVAAPAFGTTSTTRFKGKDAITFVTDCDFKNVGSSCTAYGIFAFTQRINTDGSVSNFASLELDRYQLKILDVGGVVDVTFLTASFADQVSLKIPTDLSSAIGSGTVPGLLGGNVKLSFSLSATTPLFTSRSKVVDTVGDCKVFVDRTTGKSRQAEGSAKVGRKTFVTSEFIPTSQIDTTKETSITNDCAP